MIPPPPTSTLFPYTTLFRSGPGLPAAPTWPSWPTGSRPSSRAKARSEEHTSELQSRGHLVCRLLLEKKKINAVFVRGDIVGDTLFYGQGAGKDATARTILMR